MDMKGKTALDMLTMCGAIITNDHFVYTSGKHGDAYVNKDALYPYPDLVSALCRAIAEKFAGSNVEVVVGPEKGGIILSQWVSYHLNKLERRTIPGVHAEKEESDVLSEENRNNVAIRHIHFSHGINDSTIALYRGERLVKKSDQFVFKRGYDKLVAGKNVLIVEDILNTYKTVNAVIDAVKECGGFVIGVGALCNRSDPATRNQMHLSPRTIALTRIPLSTWSAGICPLCAKDIPVRTDLGKGSNFLAKKKSA